MLSALGWLDILKNRLSLWHPNCKKIMVKTLETWLNVRKLAKAGIRICFLSEDQSQPLPKEGEGCAGKPQRSRRVGAPPNALRIFFV